MTGSLDYSLHATLPLNDNMLNNLSAKGRLALKDGVISGIDLSQIIEDTSEKLSTLLKSDRINFKETLNLTAFDTKRFTEGSTPFKLASLQYRLDGGLFFADSLLQSDKLQLQGNGQYDIQRQDINSRLQATVSTADEQSDVFKVQQMLGGSYPITVSGNIHKPLILPDLKIINSTLGRHLIKQALDKPVKDIEKQIKSLFR